MRPLHDEPGRRADRRRLFHHGAMGDGRKRFFDNFKYVSALLPAPRKLRVGPAHSTPLTRRRTRSAPRRRMWPDHGSRLRTAAQPRKVAQSQRSTHAQRQLRSAPMLILRATQPHHLCALRRPARGECRSLEAPPQHHQVGHHSVHSDRRQNSGHQSEAPDQRRVEPSLRSQRIVQPLLQSLDVEDRFIAVNGSSELPEGRRQRGR